MSHKIPITYIPSIGTSGFILHTDAGSVSVSGSLSLFGQGICATSATGSTVFITGTSTAGSLSLIQGNIGQAAPQANTLQFFTYLNPNQQFISTSATGNTLYFSSNLVFVSVGGTGRTLLMENHLIYGQGADPVEFIAPGTNGQALLAATLAPPQFGTITSTGNTLTFTAGTNSLNIELNLSNLTLLNSILINNGGTGRSILTTYGVLIGEGSLPANVSDPGTNGQIFLASTTGDPEFATISSAQNTLTFTQGPNALNIDVDLSSQQFLVNNGGTGDSILTAYGVLIGEGSLGLSVTDPGTDGQLLIAATGADPQFSTVTSAAGSVNLTSGPNSLNMEVSFSGATFSGVLPVNLGSTGRSILTTHGVLIGAGSLPVNVSAPGTDGQVFLGSTTGDPAFATISSTGGSLTFSFGHNSLNMDLSLTYLSALLPIGPSQGGLGRTILTSFGVLIGQGSLPVHVTAPGTNGQLLIASSTGNPAFATITSTGGTLTFTSGSQSLNLEANLFGSSFFNPLPVSNGGTGQTILITYGVLIGKGSLDIHVTNGGTNGQALLASSTADPAFATITSTGNTIEFTAGSNSLNFDINWGGIPLFNPFSVSYGGTGQTVLTTFGVLVGGGSLGVHVTNPGTDGQLFVAATNADPAFSTIASNNNTIDFTLGENSLNIDVGNSTGLTIQADTNNGIAFPVSETLRILGGNSMYTTGTGSSIIIEVNTSAGSFFNPMPPGSGSTGRTALTTFGVLLGAGTLPINVTAAGTHGQTLIGSTTGAPAFATITSTGGSLTFSQGPHSLHIQANWSSNTFFSILQVENGGTGQTLFSAYSVLIGKGSLPIHAAAGTNGQILLASSTGAPLFKSISSSGGTLSFNPGYNQLNMGIIWSAFLNPIPLGNGGTGQTVLTANGVLIGAGSLPIHVTAAGTNGQVLLASSTGNPKFATITSSGNTLTFTFGPNSLNIHFIPLGNTLFNPLGVNNGGTGRTFLTINGVLIGEGSLPVNVSAPGTNGQLLLASTTGDPKFARLTSTGNTLTFTFGPNSLNIDTILTNHTLFNPLRVNNGGTGRSFLTTYGVILGEGSLNVNVTPPGTNGQVLLGSSTADPRFSTITSTGNTLTFRFGANSLNIDMIIQGKTFFNPLLTGNGGTGRTLLTTYGVLLGAGSLRMNVSPPGTNGQAFLAATTADPRFARITSTGNSLTFTFGVNSLNIDINFSGTLLNPWPVSRGGTSNTSASPYAVICGGTTNASAVQSVFSVGATGQVLTSNGPGALPSFRGSGITQINVVTYSTPGTFTYTPSAAIQYCVVECIGGGGGSGGLDAGTSRQASGGGGGGGYANKTLLTSLILPSQTIVVGAGGTAGGATGTAGGAGGTTSFGVFLKATGGLGGTGAIGIGNRAPSGGAGGQGIGGDINTSGQAGINGSYETAENDEAQLQLGGAGGCSHYGGGGRGGSLLYPAAPAGPPVILIGSPGNSVGGGGGGSAGYRLSSGVVGAPGAAGLIVITEYL